MADWQRLRAAVPDYVPDTALAELIDKIVFIGADAMRHSSHVPSRKRIDLLKRLRKVEGVELATMLHEIDAETMQLIQAKEVSAIQRIMDVQDGGPFVDADGEECWVQPTIQAFGSDVYLPRGIDGLRESVRAVITDLEAQRDCAGNREKTWQGKLAGMVIAFWKSNCPGESQSAHRDRTEANSGSPLVEFGKAVFRAAGDRLSAARISNLLNTLG